ncbi:MAG: amino acid adenylation domain-containing protein [Magnetococcales bacterium]|nr:amino acid adenylation domain-containing protein [Magnetococcales bacterium]
MKKEDIQQIHPLTPMQEGMLFHALYEQTANPYFEQCQFRLRGHLDLPRFEMAWNEVMRRHEVLRARFVHKSVQQPRQVILKEQKIVIKYLDWRHLSPDGQQQAIENHKKNDWALGFDLSRDALMRMAVFQTQEQQFEVIHSFHHIILDGWSVGILHEESLQIYTALIRDLPHRLPPPVPFGRYLQWLARQDQKGAERFWQRHLSGYHHPVTLPGCTPSEHAPFQAEERHYTLSGPLSAALRQLAARHRVTQNCLIQTAWGILLARYNQAQDVVFAATVSGRPPEIPDVERMVGLFINAVPVRIRAEADMPFHRLLRQVQHEANTARDYHHHSLAEIQAKSQLGHALLDHILVFENYAAADIAQFTIADGRGGELVVEQYKQVDHSNYPLTVQVMPGEPLGFNMIINVAALPVSQVDAMMANLQAILTQVTDNDVVTVGAISLPSLPSLSALPLPRHHNTIRTTTDPKTVPLLLAATFTAEPLAPHIRWWGRAFGVNIEPSFAAYNQIFQELLNPDSLLSTHAGPALLLIRFEDWIRNLPAPTLESCRIHLENGYTQLLHALTRHRNPAPRMIALLPPSPELAELPEAVKPIHALYQRFRAWLDSGAQGPWQRLDLTELAPWFAIESIFDTLQDQTGHIPFSDPYYAAMGLWIARKIVALRATPFKVIALDCDNTLWQGICGEGGSQGVIITPGHRALQQFMVERHQEGFLLVLNSKNNPEDVWEVFANHPDMVLRREQIVTTRINWRAKSDNLREMAKELNLGLDSFVFLDDSGVECAEMMTHRPEVLTLQLPEDPEDFSVFLRLVWAFDRFAVTQEDQQRSAMYQEEQQRRQHQEQADSLEDFLHTLEIQVFMEPLQKEHLPRAAQLTQRTNQFNLSTIRRDEAAIEALLRQPEWLGWCIHVTDRFGDYGLVGVVLARQEDNRLWVDTFLLSCRVLGRGVETAILSGLRHHGLARGIDRLVAEYRPTAKNPPILAFLEQSPLEPESTTAHGVLYGAPCADLPETAPHVRFSHDRPPPPKPVAPPPAAAPTISAPVQPLDQSKAGSASRLRALRWRADLVNNDRLVHKAHYLPLTHSSGEALLALPVDGSQERDRLTTPFAPLQGETQLQLGTIWQEVLGCGAVGRYDSFFELGGHSLKAVRMVARIQKQFGVTLQLGEVFAHATIAALATLIRNRSGHQPDPIQPVAQQETYPVSNAQLRLWILQQMENDAIAYNTASLYEFRGELRADLLEQALEAVALRHESLRTTFVQEPDPVVDPTTIPATGFGQPRQRIHPGCLTRLTHLDLSGAPDPDGQARAMALEEARTPFDLAQGPVYRVTLMRLAPQRHVLLLNMHHIISDGWSLEILQNETMTLYAALLNNLPARLPPLAIQYKDYAAHQNARLQGEEATRAREYWLHKLNHQSAEPIHLPTDFPRPPVQTFQGRVLVHDFDPQQRALLTRLGNDHQATLFMVLTALIKVILLRQAGGTPESRAVIVGTPVAGRERPELEEQIGLYLNTLALHDILDPAEPFAAVLAKVKQTVTEAFAHQFYPFDRLVEELNLERDLSRSPLFDVMVVMQDLLPDRPGPAGLTITQYAVDAQISRFDLVFDFFEYEQNLRMAITSNTDLFTPERIERMVGQLTHLMRSVLTTPEHPIAGLDLLSDPERQLLLEGFNAHRHPYPRQATILDRFAAQVTATPEAIAVIAGEETLDYRQLDGWSNRIAHHLMTRAEVRAEEIIPLLTDRSAGFFAGVLGIMKAGGVCLPIDSATPRERIDFMVRDSGCRWVLFGEENDRPSEPIPLPTLTVNDFRNGSDASPSACPARWDSLAYVIYTSGSTGQPKGVLVEHGGFINMALAQIRAFGVTAEDRVLQFASPSFDASFSEIFMALLCGAALVPVGYDTIHHPERLLERMQATGVTVATLPPVYLHTLTTLATTRDHPGLNGLRTLITAGEPPIFEDALHFAARLRYFNAYGPTECSVCATWYRVLPEPERYPGGQIPIGAPLDNLSVYLLDGSDHLAPLGTVGEICVAGPGVARGYLNREALTATRFVANPWQPGTRLYRTGDLGRWRNDGTIELLGRLDEQVKIRGHRVEPGEIAHHLLQHPEVRDATLLVHQTDPNTPELIACVTPATLRPEALRSWLEPMLPGYMIPGRWIVTDRLPLTINGKIDRNALLATLARQEPRQASAHPPRSPLESRMLQIWQKVLGRGDFGITDDFFALGGDSIKAIQVVASLNDLGLETKTIFLYPTIATLAHSLENRTRRPLRAEEPDPIAGPVPLTPIQSWFFREYPVDHYHFNHAEYLFFRDPLNASALQAALQAVQAHHDMLRACFPPGAGPDGVSQAIQGPELPVDFQLLDLRGIEAVETEVDRQTRIAQSGMNLTHGPLLKTRLFRLDQEDRLLFVIHHLIIDAVSWRFLLDDILRGYEQQVAGHPITLPSKSNSFKRWSEGLQLYSRSLRLLRERHYWQAIESTPLETIPHPKTAESSLPVDIRDQNITLTPEETEALLALTRSRERPYRVIDLLLSSLAQSLQRKYNLHHVPIMLEGHGREPVVDGVDVSRTVGWFTTVFPFLLSASREQSLGEVCRTLRERLDQIPNQGIGYGILKYLTPDALKPGLSFRLKPQISFNYLGEYRLDPGDLSALVNSDLAPYRASERAGALYDWMFNAIVEGKALQIFLAYDAQRFDDHTIRDLLDTMRGILLDHTRLNDA